MVNPPANRRKVLPRRDFCIQASTVVAGVLLASCSNAFVAQEKPQSTTHVKPVNSASVNYQLPPLGYAYNALEPYIDEETMRLHHDKHHAAYVQNLNAALEGTAFASTPPEVLLGRLNELPLNIRTSVRNNGGGHVNHSMFWEIMTPGGSTAPAGDLAKAINSTFGSFTAFKTAFEDIGKNIFGSGWVWFSLDPAGKLALVSAPNQDNPLMSGSFPIMGNDVWEHAYYLKYQNRRPEYLNAWWNVLNWDKVNIRFEQAKKFIRTP